MPYKERYLLKYKGGKSSVVFPREKKNKNSSKNGGNETFRYSGKNKLPYFLRIKNTPCYNREKTPRNSGKKKLLELPGRKTPRISGEKNNLQIPRRKNTSFYGGEKTSQKLEGKNQQGCL